MQLLTWSSCAIVFVKERLSQKNVQSCSNTVTTHIVGNTLTSFFAKAVQSMLVLTHAAQLSIHFLLRKNQKCCTSLRNLLKVTLLCDRKRIKKPSTRWDLNPTNSRVLLPTGMLYRCATTTTFRNIAKLDRPHQPQVFQPCSGFPSCPGWSSPLPSLPRGLLG